MAKEEEGRTKLNRGMCMKMEGEKSGSNERVKKGVRREREEKGR